MNCARMFFFTLALVIAAISVSTLIDAQTSKGIIAGVVRDKTGAVIADASVVVTSQSTGESRTVNTDVQGVFRIDAVNPGSYTVRVEAAGFEASSARNLDIQPSIVTSYDPILVVGKVSETVTVDADSNTINTENGQLSGTVSAAKLASVPIFSLNPIELATTLPGVQ